MFVSLFTLSSIVECINILEILIMLSGTCWMDEYRRFICIVSLLLLIRYILQDKVSAFCVFC